LTCDGIFIELSFGIFLSATQVLSVRTAAMASMASKADDQAEGE
jgi:hypothetical protein